MCTYYIFGKFVGAMAPAAPKLMLPLTFGLEILGLLTHLHTHLFMPTADPAYGAWT